MTVIKFRFIKFKKQLKCAKYYTLAAFFGHVEEFDFDMN